jgi:acetyl esterase/lipase
MVGAGAADFGRPGAAAFAKRLEAAGAAVDYREYPDVEHMVIVQAALDDVFRFLDQVGEAKR